MRRAYCNLCGKEFGRDTQDYNGTFSIHTTIGYGSKYDGCELELDFCSSCMDKIIEACAITPVCDVFEEAYI